MGGTLDLHNDTFRTDIILGYDRLKFSYIHTPTGTYAWKEIPRDSIGVSLQLQLNTAYDRKRYWLR